MPVLTQPETALPEILVRSLTEGTVWDSKGTPQPLHSNISLSEAHVLFRIVADLRPAVTCEIGLAQGISAIAILGALQSIGKGIHHVMDPFQAKFDDVGLAMVARAGLDKRFIFHRRFVEEVVPSLPLIQFAFVDASHLFDLTMTEFVLLDKRLAKGGVVVFHDGWMPSLQKCTRYIISNRAYELVRDYDQRPPNLRSSLGTRGRAALTNALNLVPGKERIFREELLRPWSSLCSSNLVILRKLDDDTRDWRFHQRF